MPEPRRNTNAQVRDSSFCSGRQRPENHNGDTVLAAWRIGSALTGSLVITSKKQGDTDKRKGAACAESVADERRF